MNCGSPDKPLTGGQCKDTPETLRHLTRTGCGDRQNALAYLSLGAESCAKCKILRTETNFADSSWMK